MISNWWTDAHALAVGGAEAVGAGVAAADDHDVLAGRVEGVVPMSPCCTRLARSYLPLANRVQNGDIDTTPIDAAGKRVVIIGGGDTGADCLGTAHRQGAASVHQFEIMPRPPDERAETTRGRPGR